jgi:hypothetical protein
MPVINNWLILMGSKNRNGLKVPRLNPPQYDLPDLRGKLRSSSEKNLTPVPSIGATGQAGQARVQGSKVLGSTAKN